MENHKETQENDVLKQESKRKSGVGILRWFSLKIVDAYHKMLSNKLIMFNYKLIMYKLYERKIEFVRAVLIWALIDEKRTPTLQTDQKTS